LGYKLIYTPKLFETINKISPDLEQLNLLDFFFVIFLLVSASLLSTKNLFNPRGSLVYNKKDQKIFLGVIKNYW
jgi:hypothetical protein